MATAALNVVYNAMGSIGIKFDRHYIRETVNFHGGLNDSCEYGVLWDERNTTITKERLADVLTIAKNRQVCLITFPMCASFEPFGGRRRRLFRRWTMKSSSVSSQKAYWTRLWTVALACGSLSTRVSCISKRVNYPRLKS